MAGQLIDAVVAPDAAALVLAEQMEPARAFWPPRWLLGAQAAVAGAHGGPASDASIVLLMTLGWHRHYYYVATSGAKMYASVYVHVGVHMRVYTQRPLMYRTVRICF